MSTTKLEEEIVGVDGTSNQAMIQWFSITLPGVHLNFQRPGFVLQDRTIICGWWLVTGKILFLAKSMWNHVIFCFIPQSIFNCSYTLFRSSYNTLACLCISSTPHAFILRSLAIVSHTLHFSNNHM